MQAQETGAGVQKEARTKCSCSTEPDASATAGNDKAIPRASEEPATSVSDDVPNVHATATNTESGIA